MVGDSLFADSVATMFVALETKFDQRIALQCLGFGPRKRNLSRPLSLLCKTRDRLRSVGFSRKVFRFTVAKS
jgi:hypothetical protein